MYLFTRSARLGAGKTRDAMAWAVGITEKVNQITELDVSLWTPVFSPGVGTLTWTAMVDDLAVLEASEAKLMADDTFVAEIDRGAQFTNGQGLDDSLSQMIYGNPDPTRRPQYATIVHSAIAPGSFARGMEVGVEIAQRVEQATGISAAFFAASTGVYGGVEWVSLFETIQELQQSEAKLNADPDFLELLDGKASSAYLPNATTQIVAQLIA